MSPLFLFRLALDFLAVSLLLAAYAYNWLGNAAHEVIGTVMFALLIAHNIFNRRWYGTITKRRREARSSISKADQPVASRRDAFLAGHQRDHLANGLQLSAGWHQLHRASGPHCRRLWSTADCRPASGPAVVDDHGPGTKQAGESKPTTDLRAWVLRALALRHRCLWRRTACCALNVVSKLSMQVPMGFSRLSDLNPGAAAPPSCRRRSWDCVVHWGVESNAGNGRKIYQRLTGF